MTDTPPVLHLALDVDDTGSHPGAHAAATTRAADLVGPRHLLASVAAAENAGFTFVTFDDSLVPGTGPAVRVDAVTRAAFVAPVTSRIGLVPLVHPGVVEPFHLAAQLAALDHASLGRSGWLVGDGPVPGAREALDRPVPSGDALVEEAGDVVQVVRDLWDSWEDDAVIRDTATGRYIDRDRLHYVDFASGGEGPTASPALRGAPDGARAPFSVKGPLIVPRGPQGQTLVVARTGAVPDARVADLVDVALVDAATTAEVAGAAAAARASGAARVFVDLAVTLDTDATPGAEARTGAERLAALDDAAGATFTTSLRYTGDPAGLVALLRELRGVVDGVRILPAVLDDDLPPLVRHVLPALRVDRSAPTPRPGATLRDTLGLARPANRFAATSAVTAGSAAAAV